MTEHFTDAEYDNFYEASKRDAQFVGSEIRQFIGDLRKARAERDGLRKALERIERWFGEFPETGRHWDRDKREPMSYAAAFGSNGERDFMRAVARAALATPSDPDAVS